MNTSLDFSTATSEQIEQALCAQAANIRLARNLTQAQLAREAGLSLRTIVRLENGEGVSLDSFLRVLMALDLQHHLAALLPDPRVRPVERVRHGGTERKRARPPKKAAKKQAWTWGDEEEPSG